MERLISRATLSNFNFNKVKLIDEVGKYIGIFDVRDALVKAKGVNLDLVLINSDEDPAICKITNYDQLRYKHNIRKKQKNKSINLNKIKEVRFHVNINDNDYNCKVERIIDFLSRGYKVKVSLLLRGREFTIHGENMNSFVEGVVKRVENFGVLEGKANFIGKSVFLIIRSIRKGS